MKKIMTLAIIALAAVTMISCCGQYKKKADVQTCPATECVQQIEAACPAADCASCPKAAECQKAEKPCPTECATCPKAAECPKAQKCDKECPKAKECKQAAPCTAK